MALGIDDTVLCRDSDAVAVTVESCDVIEPKAGREPGRGGGAGGGVSGRELRSIPGT